jgi:hypothetical protein
MEQSKVPSAASTPAWDGERVSRGGVADQRCVDQCGRGGRHEGQRWRGGDEGHILILIIVLDINRLLSPFLVGRGMRVKDRGFQVTCLSGHSIVFRFIVTAQL